MRFLIFGIASILAVVVSGVTLTAGNAEVVIPRNPTYAVRFAAEELTNFLSRTFGQTVSLVHAPSTDKVSLILGDNEWSCEAGLPAQSGRGDAFTIHAEGDRIFILGEDDPSMRLYSYLNKGGTPFTRRGTLHGVYAFLEDYAGVRLYFPGELGEIVPRRNVIIVPEGERIVRPDFPVREWYLGYNAAWFGEEKLTNPRLEHLDWVRLRMGTDRIPCCHGSIHFKYLDRFADSHPEYFILNGNGTRSTGRGSIHSGHLCYSSAVCEEMYQDVKAALTGCKPRDRGIPLDDWGPNVRGRIVDIMPVDGMERCNCEKCRTVMAKEADDGAWATTLVWSNTARIARRLMEEGIDGTISQMAYGYFRGIPEFDLPSNIVVQVAINGPWSMDRKDQIEKENGIIRGWVEKLGHKVWIWTYAIKHPSPGTDIDGIPQVTPHYWGNYYKAQAPFIYGAFAESESDRFSFNYLNYYVYSRVCWDSSADIDAILDEHYRLMFGAGAEDVKRLYDEIERKWVTEVVGAVRNTSLGPVMSVPTHDDVYRRIYSDEVLSRWEGYVAAAIAKTGAGTIEGRRARLMGDEFVGSIRRATKKHLDHYATIVAYRAKGSRDVAIPLRPFKSKKFALPEDPVRTAVKVWVENDEVHIVFGCEEPHMDKVVATERPHDNGQIWTEDSVEARICAEGKREICYYVTVNSAGAWSERRFSPEGKIDGCKARQWGDGKVKVEVTRRSNGWNASIVMPVSEFGELKDSVPAFFARNRVLSNGCKGTGKYVWGPEAIGGFGDYENYGTIDFERAKD